MDPNSATCTGRLAASGSTRHTDGPAGSSESNWGDVRWRLFVIAPQDARHRRKVPDVCRVDSILGQVFSGQLETLRDRRRRAAPQTRRDWIQAVRGVIAFRFHRPGFRGWLEARTTMAKGYAALSGGACRRIDRARSFGPSDLRALTGSRTRMLVYVRADLAHL